MEQIKKERFMIRFSESNEINIEKGSTYFLVFSKYQQFDTFEIMDISKTIVINLNLKLPIDNYNGGHLSKIKYNNRFESLAQSMIDLIETEMLKHKTVFLLGTDGFDYLSIEYLFNYFQKNNLNHLNYSFVIFINATSYYRLFSDLDLKLIELTKVNLNIEEDLFRINK